MTLLPVRGAGHVARAEPGAAHIVKVGATRQARPQSNVGAAHLDGVCDHLIAAILELPSICLGRCGAVPSTIRGIAEAMFSHPKKYGSMERRALRGRDALEGTVF
jgi:hypothetical protein